MTPERAEEIRIMSLPGMQEKFREVMGDSKGPDRFYCLTCGASFDYFENDCHCNSYEVELWIRLPFPIDPVNPSRGLWGMVRWEEFCVSAIDREGNMLFQHISTGKCWREEPTLALLKAITVQEGIEMEEEVKR